MKPFPIREYKIFSQNGEDGVISSIFENVGAKYRTFIEIGYCKTEANSINLTDFKGVVIDADVNNLPLHSDKIISVCSRITVENLESILLPFFHLRESLDFLSLDIDFNDYWILREILRLGFAPRIICLEYNASMGPIKSVTVKYDANGGWDYHTRYFGASMMAFVNLLKNNYRLVYAESRGVNLFFVQKSELSEFNIPDPEKLFRPPNYSRFRSEHDVDTQNREWVNV